MYVKYKHRKSDIIAKETGYACCVVLLVIGYVPDVDYHSFFIFYVETVNKNPVSVLAPRLSFSCLSSLWKYLRCTRAQ